MKYFTIFLALFFISTNNFAQNSKSKPNWISFNKRNINFPQSKYLVGFINENVNSSENYTDAKDRISSYARTGLAESVQMTIKSITQLNTIIEDEEVYSLINKTSISLSELKISGLTEEFYYDKRGKIYYAIAYAEKTSVIENYSKSLNLKFDKIDVNLKKAAKYTENKDKKNALKTYFSNMPIFREAEKEITILVALGGSYKPFSQQILEKKSENEQNVALLIKSKSNTLNDIAFFMAYSLNFQIEDKTQETNIENFTLSSTNSASEFSRLFKKVFKVKLASTGFNVTTNSKNNKKTPFVIKGTYWENDDMLEIMCSVSETKSGKIIASAENQIKKTYLEENNIDFKTQNIQSFIDLQDSLNNQIVESGNMTIDLFTNYGKENLIFEESDTLKLYIKANKECFVRFIYHLADGSKVLLLDNFLVERGDVNKLIKIEQEFECYPPFGTEVLQLNAQTSPFEPLKTNNVDGYEFIQDDISKILAINRGFKPISNKEAKAQKSIIITTLPKE